MSAIFLLKVNLFEHKKHEGGMGGGNMRGDKYMNDTDVRGD